MLLCSKDRHFLSAAGRKRSPRRPRAALVPTLRRAVGGQADKARRRASTDEACLTPSLARFSVRKRGRKTSGNLLRGMRAGAQASRRGQSFQKDLKRSAASSV